jgi:hypothetical protein
VTVQSLNNAFEHPDDEFGAFEGGALLLARSLGAQRRDGGQHAERVHACVAVHAVRYDPRDDSPDSTALLRIALHRLPAPVAAPYALPTLPTMRICVQVTRAEADQLRDTLGGDLARMRVLQKLVALSGPRSLDARAAGLIACIS